METKFFSAKATVLTVILLFGIRSALISSSFIAAVSGNWSSPSSWGGNQPGFVIGSSNTVTIPDGVTILLDSNLTVQGGLFLTGGSLSLNGQNMTIVGSITTTGKGGIIGNKNSNLAFTGYGGEGNFVFSAADQTIQNLTINIGSNSGVYLGSDLTVVGALSLLNGFLGIGDNNITVSGKGGLQGGSASSYIMTVGTGSLIMPVKNASTIFHVGTQTSYAPVAITNNASTSNSIGVSVMQGVFTAGMTGNYITDKGMVNTTWNLSSSSKLTDVKLEMFWNANMEVNGFDPAQAYISLYAMHTWNTSLGTAATVYNNGLLSLQLDGVSSFGQFAVFSKSVPTYADDIKDGIPFTIYPNPAGDLITIAFQEPGNNTMMKIFDVNGNDILSQRIVDPLTSINISKFAAGNYFVSVNSRATKIFTKK